ncbi:carboxypeptidase-like regulatory domain-containing protein [Olivibacter domesticus]|uniref:CarboxypepD_reg-like domain-containing protein n=1 Tax=Olivibacter domesticus TaxID=407022 RepID=A0A1H7GNK6_OLID1|nr:carboxypeptidase-like regulatory domain-containing protein [Olivibacter domesticus]SEK38572.1 CarboxypepD_reg-like domain-containing protein [Olivibacter domesticus]
MLQLIIYVRSSDMRQFRKLTYLSMLICLPILGYSQVVLQGKVVNGQNDKPISGASVFLNSSSIGSSANALGEFSFPISQPGNYEVVVSSIGYEPLVFMLQVTEEKLAPRLIKLKPAPNILDEVVIEANPGAGWRKWGRVFEEAFIGTGRNARSCRILNKEDIYFEYNKEQHILRAFARKPIVVENKALGYTINYLLQGFHIDYRNKIQFYAGYPHFANIKVGKKFERRRERSYTNSLMHFIRSLYQNNLAEQGFEMRYIAKSPNKEKFRVKGIYKNNKGHSDDSLAYYREVLKQADTLSLLSPQLLTADSVIKVDANGNKWLSCTHDLQIVGNKIKEDPLYVSQQLKTNRGVQHPVSILQFKIGRQIVIDANGTYYDPRDLLCSAYWGWASRIADMVPLDYKAKH